MKQYLILGFCTCRIHLNRFRIILNAPNTAGADTGADTAADALIGVGYVFPAAIRFFDAGDGFFRAGFQTHLTVTAGTAADAACMVVHRVAKQAVMAFVKVSLGESPCRNLLFLREGLNLLSHHILVNVVSRFTAAADGVRKSARLDGIAGREYALCNGLVSLRHEPALAEEFNAFVFGQEVEYRVILLVKNGQTSLPPRPST